MTVLWRTRSGGGSADTADQVPPAVHKAFPFILGQKFKVSVSTMLAPLAASALEMAVSSSCIHWVFLPRGLSRVSLCVTTIPLFTRTPVSLDHVAPTHPLFILFVL